MEMKVLAPKIIMKVLLLLQDLIPKKKIFLQVYTHLKNLILDQLLMVLLEIVITVVVI